MTEKRLKETKVTERLPDVGLKWVACWILDRVACRAVFMKTELQPTNSVEHGGGGLSAPKVPISKISTFVLHFEAIISGSVCCKADAFVSSRAAQPTAGHSQSFSPCRVV